MTEAEFQTKFSRWIPNFIKKTCAYELKVSRANTFPFSAIRDHQIVALLATKRSERGLNYKIPDVGYDQKPFDGVFLYQEDAFLGVLFYLKRGDKEFYLINFEKIKELIDSDTKSINKETAKSIADYIGNLA